LCSLDYNLPFFWIFRTKNLHALPQPHCIQGVDGKCPVAALRAPGPASQPCPCPARRIAQRRIHNLHKFVIARRQPHAPSIAEITPTRPWPRFHLRRATCYNGLEVILLYLERIPAAPLNQFIRSLWYARSGNVAHRRERVLPGGSVEIILNLARDYLLECPEIGDDRRTAPALVVGARSIYEIIDSSDMADLIGAVFVPGGFAPFAFDSVDLFSNRGVSLEDVWGASVRSLRDRLRELHTPHARLRCFEEFLVARFAMRLEESISPWRGVVQFSLNRFGRSSRITTVEEVARLTGWSERRFSQVFREEVGLSPKLWCRVQRFQRTVHQLHAGRLIRWAELALDCGYYDQSHFANEFRAFSGIDATTYSALRGGPWANHIPAK
jgi:AraC-like DNA-binding protein